MIDLERVRRGDALLDQAKTMHEDQGRTPRPVPIEEIMSAAQQAYSPDEAAELLGVHKETIYREIRKGALQAAKFGRAYRISKPDLAKWWKARGGGELFDEDQGGADE